MDYEKAYKEALERAKDSFSYPSMPGFMRVDVIFPELKKSEDERIRKGLIDLIYKVYADTNYITCVEHEEMLAWLEKQKTVEWSKEDKAHLGNIIHTLRKVIEEDPNTVGAELCQESINWLEKQKPIEQDKDIQDEYDRKYNEGKAVGIEIGKDEMRKQLSAKWDEEDEKPYLRT